MTVYPTRGSAESFTGSAYGSSGHIHPGYVSHILSAVEPPNPTPGMLWTTGGSQELSWVGLSVAGEEVDDFPGYDEATAFTAAFALPGDPQETVSALVRVVASVAPNTEGGSDLTPYPVLRFTPAVFQPASAQITLDPAAAIVADTYEVAAPATWLPDMYDAWSLGVSYVSEGTRVDIIDLSVLLVRNGVTYTWDGAQWTVFSTAGEVISSHNELSGRSTADAHPISAITALKGTLDGKLSPINVIAGDNISVDATDSTVTITGLDPTVDHGTLEGLDDDDHPQYLDASRGYTRSLADQTFVNVIGDAIIGDLDVGGRIATSDLQVRSPDASHSAIEFADQSGVRRAEISSDDDLIEFRSIAGTVMAHVTVGRTEIKGMLNVQPAGVTNELSITAGEGQPDNTVIIDGFGLYADVSQGTGLWLTEIPGDNTTWSQVGGAGTHNHNDDYVLKTAHGSDDHSGLVAQLAPISHVTSAEDPQGGGDLLHVQYAQVQPSDLGLNSDIGVSDTLARADHVHALPTLAELNAAAAAHTHAASEINTGTIAFARLPTGTTSSTVAVGSHTHAYVPNTRVLTAGAGLSGGGALSQDRAFDIGAGTGITVNPDSIEVNKQTLDGWYEFSGETASQLSDHTTPGTTPDPHTQYQLESEKGTANGYAPLDGSGVIPESYIPAVPPNELFSVANATERTTYATYTGNSWTLNYRDEVIQEDDGTLWVYVGPDPAASDSDIVAGNWTQKSSGGVVSVNGETGAVTGFVKNNRSITADSGLTGGGDLSADLAFSVGAGTGISVGVNSVSIDLTYTDDRYEASGAATAAITAHHAAGSSDHDDRYYTENETDTLLAGKSDDTHLHDDDYVNISGDTMTGELRVNGDFSASGVVRTGSHPADYASKPGFIWIREDDDTGSADPVFDPANYAGVDHDHDERYSVLNHNHQGDFASSGHKHDLDYSPIGHDHQNQFLSLDTGGEVTGDIDVTGLVSQGGLVRQADPAPLKPGMLWIDTDDPGTSLGDPAQHFHDDRYVQAQPVRFITGGTVTDTWLTQPDLPEYGLLSLRGAEWTFVAPYPGMLRTTITWSLGATNRADGQLQRYYASHSCTGTFFLGATAEQQWVNRRSSSGNSDFTLISHHDVWLDTGATATPELWVQNGALGSSNNAYNYITVSAVFIPAASVVVDSL